ncbi:MAG: sulfatase [Planctomycetes bacterium]|nr:sulfatase [Planctomycetota bacterium]
MPSFNEQWRAVLPTSVWGISRFAAVAVVIDALLALAGGGALLIFLTLLGRLVRALDHPERARLISRTIILGTAGSYLYTGWMGLYVLLSQDRRSLTYLIILVVGAVLSFGIAFAVSAALGAMERRDWRRAPRVAWCAAAVILLLVTAPSYARYRNSKDIVADIPVSSGGPRPNVLLVTLDTLRMDYLGCYGHPWIETPAVDALAADAVLFETAIAQACSTTPSHCSIMTGVYPFEHGAENGKPMREDLVTLAEVLQAHGYETVGFVSATTTRSINTGLHRGFGRYEDSLVSWSTTLGRDEFQHLMFFYLVGIAQNSQIPGNVVTNRALDWLENRSDGPFFAWLHYFDPHIPYGSPPPFRDRYKGKITDGLPMAEERERYAEDVSFADFHFGRFLDALKAEHLYDDTIIIVVSDHGEAFGETHGDEEEYRHGRNLYDTTQRVPLIIKTAGAGGGSRRVDEQVELTDIAPTVLSLLAIDIPTAFVGKPLDELLDGRRFSYAGRDAHAFNVVDLKDPDRPSMPTKFVQLLALRSPQWKYITSPRVLRAELYNLTEDPAEQHNLADAQPEIARARHGLISPYWDPNRDTAQDPRQRLAPALVRQLQGLGYLGGNPKD